MQLRSFADMETQPKKQEGKEVNQSRQALVGKFNKSAGILFGKAKSQHVQNQMGLVLTCCNNSVVQ